MANEGSIVLKVQEDISAHLKSIASTSFALYQPAIIMSVITHKIIPAKPPHT